jgi:hypothetical protein
VKIQILNTYAPIKILRSSDDVALELQRQLSFSSSCLRTNMSSVDPSVRAPPIEVIKCSETSLFEAFCGTKQSLSPPVTWLGLQPDSYSTIFIFVAAALLVCILIAICGLCVRRCWQDRKQVEDKAKWIVAVQQEQAHELQGAKTQPRGGSETPELLPLTIAIPSLPVAARATPSPSPRSIPPIQDPDSNLYQYDDDLYMDTPPSGETYGEEAEHFVEECWDVTPDAQDPSHVD